MLHPIMELVQIWKFWNGIPIPNQNFHNSMFGMVSQSIKFSNWTNSCLGSNILYKYILCQFGRPRDWYNLQISTARLYNKPTCKFQLGIAIQFWNWTNSGFGRNIYICVYHKTQNSVCDRNHCFPLFSFVFTTFCLFFVCLFFKVDFAQRGHIKYLSRYSVTIS